MNADSPSNLQAQLDSLRRLFVVALAVLTVIAGSVAWYFRSEKKVLNIQYQQAAVNINQWEKQALPRINELVEQLQIYSRTHPDILPILAKYGMSPSGHASAPQNPPPSK